MAKLPRPSGREMLDFLQRQGLSIIRIRSSHHVMKRGDVYTTVPVHGNRSLKTGTLRKILRDIGMSPTEFADLWNA